MSTPGFKTPPALGELLSFVRSHEGFENARIQDGAIWADVAWVHVDTLEQGSDYSRVGSTLSECRDFLGY